MKTSTGYRSTGDYSTGDYSTGDRSTGDHSTGYRSTGDYSTGDHSTGYRSTGDYSTGNWSISDYSSGHFSTEDYSGFGCFDKSCTLEEWENAKKPGWLYCGYLKTYSYKEAFQKSYNKATREEQLKIKDLPNFDADKFLQISGIQVEDEDKTIQLSNGVKISEKTIREALEYVAKNDRSQLK